LVNTNIAAANQHLTDGLLADIAGRVLCCLHIGAHLACCGGGQSAFTQKMAEAEGNRLSVSRIPYGTGELSAPFFIIIFMSCILFNLMGVCYKGKIPDLRLEVLRSEALPVLDKDFLCFHSCPQTISPASVFMTAANSGMRPSGRGGCRAATPSHLNFKNIYFVNAMISNFVRDLHFFRNQPLKSPDN
jgi:hypothetical protein